MKAVVRRRLALDATEPKAAHAASADAIRPFDSAIRVMRPGGPVSDARSATVGAIGPADVRRKHGRGRDFTHSTIPMLADFRPGNSENEQPS